MDSDEEPKITNSEDAAWVGQQRALVADYLTVQRCEHAGISLEPRYFLSPYLAIWAVRSKVNPDRIGWWAVSGDVPTDYITCTNEQDDADVLLSFSRAWRSAAVYMAEGRWAPDHHIGPPGQQKELAPLLLRRAEMLQELADDMKGGRAGDKA